MNFIEHKLNAFYYCLYLMEKKLHLAFNRINILLLLFRIPYIKNRMKKKYGIEDPLDFYNDFFLNKEYGFSFRYIFGAFFSTLLILLLTISIFVNKLLRLNIQFRFYHLIIFGVISYVIHYYLIDRKDIYLKYFEKFEKWNTRQKRRNVIFSLLFIILVMALLIESLI